MFAIGTFYNKYSFVCLSRVPAMNIFQWYSSNDLENHIAGEMFLRWIHSIY